MPRPGTPRKRVLIPAGIVALFIMMGALGGGGDDTTPVAANTTTTASPTKAATASADPAAAKAKAEADAKAKAKAEADAKAKAAAAAKVKAAAEAKVRAAAAAERNPKSYKAIGTRAYAKLVKDPDAHVGEKFVVYARVTQFDSATGQDTFRADSAATRQGDWYDYDINTLVQTDDPKLFADVVQDDLVTLYVEVAGSFSYDTQIGGNTTVPLLKANIIKVTGSAG